jgi:hypothetical protein
MTVADTIRELLVHGRPVLLGGARANEIQLLLIDLANEPIAQEAGELLAMLFEGDDR